MLALGSLAAPGASAAGRARPAHAATSRASAHGVGAAAGARGQRRGGVHPGPAGGARAAAGSLLAGLAAASLCIAPPPSARASPLPPPPLAPPAIERAAPVYADVAARGLYDNLNKDRAEPFTIYGNIFKRYTIQDLDERGRVVRERRGFTATACVNVIPGALETPQFASLPEMAKVNYNDKQTCRKTVAQTKEDACTAPCDAACDVAVRKYAAGVLAETGLELPEGTLSKLVRRCSRNCKSDCSRPGNSFTFEVPFRP